MELKMLMCNYNHFPLYSNMTQGHCPCMYRFQCCCMSLLHTYFSSCEYKKETGMCSLLNVENVSMYDVKCIID